MTMINPYVTEEHLERAFPNQKGTRVVVEESALEAIKAMAQRLQDERDELLASLIECSERLRIHMKHTEDLMADMRACKIIAKCTSSPKVME